MFNLYDLGHLLYDNTVLWYNKLLTQGVQHNLNQLMIDDN